MDPAVPSEVRLGYDDVTRGLDVPSQTVAMDPLGLNTLETPVLVGG